MSHTNHRTGTIESLQKDFAVIMMPARGINEVDTGLRLQKFLQIGYKYHPVNAGPARTGDVFMTTPEHLVSRERKSKIVQIVFDDKKNLEGFIRDLVATDLGYSVIVSGLFEEVEDVCQKVGIKRHTTLSSLGVWGRIERLPGAEVMDIATMCGHGMIAFNLVKDVIERVKKGSLSVDEGARTLARPCACGVFNPARAKRLLQQYSAK
jgi:hypothetical protein